MEHLRCRRSRAAQGLESDLSALAELYSQLTAQRDEIEAWFETEFAKQTMPFYCSVDLRVSDHKLAPVDANLFPGGFNNLAQATHAQAGAAAKKVLARQWPSVQRCVLVVEHQTRNPYYAVHLNVLKGILVAAGLDVRLAFLEGEAATLSGHHIEIEIDALERSGDQLSIGDFVPELVLLNHDQSGGVPAILEGVKAEIAPILDAGWSKRRKSMHFFQYERVVNRFASAFGLDAWLMQAYFNVCNRVDVSKHIGLDCLARAVDETLQDIHANYKRVVGCVDKPFVVLKADAGTYGMGVVMLDDAESARNLNRRQRQNLSVVKDGVAVRDILIQEGVATSNRVEGLVAEPVYYMIGTEVVGGFWRLNQSQGSRDNLNSRGMLFWPMAEGHQPREAENAQRVIARLALLATAREMAGDLALSVDA